MTRQVLLLPGDGIGCEVVREARLVLEQVAPACAPLQIAEADFGGIAINRLGSPLPSTTLAQARAAEAVLLGAVGAPRYDSLPQNQRPEKGLLQLRAELAVFANLRPVRTSAALIANSPLRPELARSLDILIVRELIGGIYFGQPRGYSGDGPAREAHNTMRYRAAEVKRIGKVAFEAALGRKRRLCSVDKANVLEVSCLWREEVEALAADHEEVALSHMYVDNAAMQLALAPAQFDVLVTSNLFGDILSDLASALAGSIGMMPSASLAADGSGIYEPVHGSAPEIAGRDQANPCAAILSMAMLLRHSLAEAKAATRIEAAVEAAIADGQRTADIAIPGQQPLGCQAMGAAVRSRLAN